MLAALAEVQSDSDRDAISLLLSKGNVNLAASQVCIELGCEFSVSKDPCDLCQIELDKNLLACSPEFMNTEKTPIFICLAYKIYDRCFELMIAIELRIMPPPFDRL